MISLVGSAVISNVLSALVAIFILAPLLNEGFGDTLRKQLEVPSLTGGYLVLSILMVLAYPYFKFSQDWKANGVIFGLLCGGMTFLSDHMITAGWSVLPPIPMLISGLIDSIVTVICGLFIAYIYSWKTALNLK